MRLLSFKSPYSDSFNKKSHPGNPGWPKLNENNYAKNLDLMQEQTPASANAVVGVCSNNQ